MSMEFRLKPEMLTSKFNLDELKFETTEEVKPLKGIIGQDRGTQAIRFGLKMRKRVIIFSFQVTQELEEVVLLIP